ncbi:MAG: LacI family DNA-binding transcriptional regulator [Bacillota bacterium]
MVKATIKEVAAEAKVSTATVSRVLNNSLRVSDEARRRVSEAIAKLHYEPSAIARSLKQDKTFMIGIIVPDITNPYFMEISKGIEDTVQQSGFQLMFCSSDENSVVTIVAMLFHAMSGYALARFRFPGKAFMFTWMLSTLMVPFAVIMIPLYLITKNLGLANSYAGLIIPSIFNAYGIFLFRQFYMDFPKELEEAGYMEGLSLSGTFFRLALPLSVPIIVPLTIGFFLTNWNSYMWPLIITQDENLWVVQQRLAHLVGGGYFTPWNIVLAAAVIVAIPTLILFFVAQKYLVEGIKMSGIK